ncbi:AAA family ATPase [Acidimangrovimonas sediminis]|uniref:AAA family ATPase n=1 Tax=Acidimangrovimonas sediminis TaxID=2056283 RepID=UPI000C80894C|nr:AAA family ATPase [Acidimangrovimonas sediminis]
MTKISFIYARFFDGNESSHAIERRLITHLQELRTAKLPSPPPGSEDEDEGIEWEVPSPAVRITPAEGKRIRRRAENVVERREAASGLGHLRREDREALRRLRDGVRLAPITSEAQADEIAASLHSAMPWMQAATAHLWHAMRRSAHRGETGFRLPPLLLHGPPGIGKSVWARRVSEVLAVPLRTVEASGEQASFGVVGSQRGWGSAFPGKPLQTILQHLVANPIIVVDEIEKAGVATSTRGMRCSLTEALLPLLERATAKEWECPYYQVRFDMSWISWIMTANDTSSLPDPFLSRIEVVSLGLPGLADLKQFALHLGERQGLAGPAIEAVVKAIEVAFTQGLYPNLRTVIRMLERAEALQRLPVVH